MQLIFLPNFITEIVDYCNDLTRCLTGISVAGQSSPCQSSPDSKTDDKSRSPTLVPTMLVMSGGEGYIDFRVGSTNTGNI